jgi:L-threonylcarbamoyladenylate synthase
MQTERVIADAAGILRAAETLRAGGLVAFPTETVYGLGARADRGEAVLRIFEAKGRPADNPLIVHVAGLAEARELAAGWSDEAEALARAFWPGPLTLVVRRRADRVAGEVAAGKATVAVRVPVHEVARALLEACGLPIAAPSANRSNGISPTTAEHVMKGLRGRVDLVLDGGPTGYGIESTIVDVSRPVPALLRHGAVPRDAIAALVPLEDRGGRAAALGEEVPAPGSYARHYAPRARMSLVPPAAIRGEVARLRQQGRSVGALERGARSVEGGAVEVLPDDPAGFAAGLYAALHRLEDAGCDAIVAAEPPATPAWLAVADRLRRACAAP